MINVLEFDMDINYKYAWNISARSVYYLNDNLDECMILYKFNLSDGYIWSKFGTGDPDRIIFDKLIGKSLIIFHSEIFKEKTNRFEDLLIFCQEKGIDVYIPLSISVLPHVEKMKQVLSNFEFHHYDFTKMKHDNKNVDFVIRERLKPLIRQIKLGKLL